MEEYFFHFDKTNMNSQYFGVFLYLLKYWNKLTKSEKISAQEALDQGANSELWEGLHARAQEIEEEAGESEGSDGDTENFGNEEENEIRIELEDESGNQKIIIMILKPIINIILIQMKIQY